jgi:hypothetical protein
MIAVDIAMLFHGWSDVVTGGFVGVDLFFLLFRLSYHADSCQGEQ